MPLSKSSLEGPKNIKYHIEQLRHHLEDYSDKIPEQWMHGSEGQQYKVKMGWWQSLIDTLDFANIEAVTELNLKEEIESFINEYSGSGMTHRGTAKEDIDKANALLKKVIENLQNST